MSRLLIMAFWTDGEPEAVVQSLADRMAGVAYLPDSGGICVLEEGAPDALLRTVLSRMPAVRKAVVFETTRRSAFPPRSASTTLNPER